MNITFDELRALKHKLPSGSIHRIAEALNVSEQTVRNYFGAHDYEHGDSPGTHFQSGPHGGIFTLEDTTIYELAKKIIEESEKSSN